MNKITTGTPQQIELANELRDRKIYFINRYLDDDQYFDDASYRRVALAKRRRLATLTDAEKIIHLIGTAPEQVSDGIITNQEWSHILTQAKEDSNTFKAQHPDDWENSIDAYLRSLDDERIAFITGE